MKHRTHLQQHRTSLLILILPLLAMLSFAGCDSGESEKEKLKQRLREEIRYLDVAWAVRNIPDIRDVYRKEEQITPEMRAEYDSMIIERWEQIQKDYKNGYYMVRANSIFNGSEFEKKAPADPIQRRIAIRWAEAREELIWLNDNLSTHQRGEATKPIASRRQIWESEDGEYQREW